MNRVGQAPAGIAPRVVSRRRASFWTILATVAGVIGAAAAAYPLLSSDPQFVHLTLSDDFLYADALAEPVILTGNWRIKRTRPWWWDEIVFERGRDPHDVLRDAVPDIKDKRVPAADTTGRRFVTLVRLYPWADDVENCPLDASDFRLGLEFKGRVGLGWAYTKVPICIVPREKVAVKRRAAAQAAKERADAEAKAGKASQELHEFLARACKEEANRNLRHCDFWRR